MSDAQRAVQVRLLTRAGWFEGGLQVPQKSGLLDYLNRSGGLVRMTDVVLEGHEQSVPFLGVRLSEMGIVLPPLAETERDDTPHPVGEAHDVAGVMRGLLFQGTVRLAQGQRVSDFFASAKGFVRVSNVRLWLGDAKTGFHDRRNEAELLAHAPSLIAVSDTLGES
jgi:hypothetical protein